jgi:hypothetical protein
MPRYPDDALDVAMSDDYRVMEARTGRSSQDPVPAPKEPGFFGRIYNAIVGNKHVETDTPLKRSDQIPTLTDAPVYPYDQTIRRPREPKAMTIEDIEAANPGATEEELNDLILKHVQQSRRDRLAPLAGIERSVDLRKPALPPISPEPETEDVSEPDTDDSESDEDVSESVSEDVPEDLYETKIEKSMSGGGHRMVLGNAALATIILAMSVFQG